MAPFNSDSSLGLAINNAGHVVGSVDNTQSGDWAYHNDTRWSNNMHKVNPAFYPRSVAVAINDVLPYPTVVGNYGSATETFAFSNIASIGFVTLDGNGSEANDVNNFGQIVGKISTGTGSSHAVLWQNGQRTDLDPQNPSSSVAQAINDQEQVVGWRNTGIDTQRHGFLWDSTNGMQDLGTLDNGPNSVAWDINEAGQIVGISDINPQSDFRAFVYKNGEMQNLNDLIITGSGWTLLSATGINEFGQIAGWGTLNGSYRGFLLNPIIDDTQAPTATLTADDIIVGGTAPYSFSVTYSDNIAIDIPSVYDSDIRVIGPNGYDQVATYYQIDSQC